MRSFAGQYTSTKQVGGQIGIPVLVLATRETTIVPGIGKQMTTLSEVELLFPDGRSGWYNEDVIV